MNKLQKLSNDLYTLLAFHFVRRDYELHSYTQETDGGSFEVKYTLIVKDEVAKIKQLVCEPKKYWTKKMIDMYCWQRKYKYTDKRVDDDWMFRNELNRLSEEHDAQFRFITNEQLNMIYPSVCK